MFTPWVACSSTGSTIRTKLIFMATQLQFLAMVRTLSSRKGHNYPREYLVINRRQWYQRETVWKKKRGKWPSLWCIWLPLEWNMSRKSTYLRLLPIILRMSRKIIPSTKQKDSYVLWEVERQGSHKEWGELRLYKWNQMSNGYSMLI